MRAARAAAAREPGRTGERASTGRAFRGLALVFVLSFLNLVGVVLTATALGGVEPWTRWEFVGLFGALEAGAGLANVLAPNLWRLPVAELETSSRTDVRLAASVLLLPHWGGLARTAAGVVFLGLAAWQAGVGPATLGVVPLVVALGVTILAVSALAARAGVARPDLDVVQFVVRHGSREHELRPISIGASVFQFLLTVATIPAAKTLPPGMLYLPELGPSPGMLVGTCAVALGLAVVTYVAWSGRVAFDAPEEQQREAEAEA